MAFVIWQEVDMDTLTSLRTEDGVLVISARVKAELRAQGRSIAIEREDTDKDGKDWASESVRGDYRILFLCGVKFGYIHKLIIIKKSNVSSVMVVCLHLINNRFIWFSSSAQNNWKKGKPWWKQRSLEYKERQTDRQTDRENKSRLHKEVAMGRVVNY